MRIRLVLARAPEFPVGSCEHGYEFIAPLKAGEHIDGEAWKTVKEKCRVVRFWGDEPERDGLLRHVGHGWRFDYHTNDDAGDEPFFKLDKHSLSPGAYVSGRIGAPGRHPGSRRIHRFGSGSLGAKFLSRAPANEAGAGRNR